MLYGAEEYSGYPGSYKERMARVEKPLTARLHRAFPNPAEYDEVTGLVWAYGGEMEAVSMEVGLQIGVLLAAQVCQNLIAAQADGAADRPADAASGN